VPCPGCIDSAGELCLAGTADSACGSAASPCDHCINNYDPDRTCVAQSCQ
jgi:hypothetical protein